MHTLPEFRDPTKPAPRAVFRAFRAGAWPDPVEMEALALENGKSRQEARAVASEYRGIYEQREKATPAPRRDDEAAAAEDFIASLRSFRIGT